MAGTEFTTEAPDITDNSFIFWHINDGETKSVTTNKTIAETLGTLPFSATAWYVGIGGNGCTHIRVHPFSISSNSAMSDNPIESVSPAGAWSDPSTNMVSVQNSNVEVTVKNTLNGENFDSWMIFGSATTNGRTIAVDKQHCPLIIALYKKAEPVPVHPGIIDELIPELSKIKELIDLRFDPVPYDILRLREMVTRGLESAIQPVVKAVTAKTAAKKTAAKKAVTKKATRTKRTAKKTSTRRR